MLPDEFLFFFNISATFNNNITFLTCHLYACSKPIYNSESLIVFENLFITHRYMLERSNLKIGCY